MVDVLYVYVMFLYWFDSSIGLFDFLSVACSSLLHRLRPVVPVFAGSPMPSSGGKNMERSSMLLQAYFRPWTLRVSEATQFIPHVAELRKNGETWLISTQKWMQEGVMCEEAARYLNNFMNVTRIRPTDSHDLEACSEDLVSDEELFVNGDVLEDALRTKVGGRQREVEEDGDPLEHVDEGGNDHFSNSSAAISRAQQIWGIEEVEESTRERKSLQVQHLQDVLLRA